MNRKDLAGLVYPEFRFGKTEIEEGLALVEAGAGGFCFYGGTAEEVQSTAHTLKKAAGRPLLIAADYEEGAGRRVRGMTELPSNMALGAADSEEAAFEKGFITGREAVSIGVDWVFAPVLDLAVNADNPIVSLRSFGSDADKVSALAGAFCDGLMAGGALSSVKHFPGHGRTVTDSHLAMPEINESSEIIRGTDLQPFRRLLQRTDAVMVGHLLVNAFDDEFPASLSRKIITDLLRGEMKFDETVITDALNMKALSAWGEPGVLALKAGADILLYPENPYSLIQALEKAVENGEISKNRIKEAIERQKKLAYRATVLQRAAAGEKEYEGAVTYNLRLAEKSVTVICGRDILPQGVPVAYFEPCRSWEEREGKLFTDALEANGIPVRPYHQGCGLRIVAGIFSGPQAYSGRINLSPEQKSVLEKVILEDRKAFVFSFGSPFALKGIVPEPVNAFCTYGRLPEFLRAAAAAAAGRGKAEGVLPVDDF